MEASQVDEIVAALARSRFLEIRSTLLLGASAVRFKHSLLESLFDPSPIYPARREPRATLRLEIQRVLERTQAYQRSDASERTDMMDCFWVRTFLRESELPIRHLT